MPLFEFECSKCKEVFEIICKMDEYPACPVCGCLETGRLIAKPAPLKTGAFPYKIGPVHPLAGRMASGLNRSCGASQGCAHGKDQ